MDIKTSFGNRCRQLRLKAGLSQEKFASLIGMDRSYYASIELGHRNISINNIHKIAKGLNISISSFFKGVK